MDSATTPKRCCRCKNMYPATPDFFNRSKNTKDGLHPECRDCKNVRRKTSQRLTSIPVLYDDDLKRCTSCQEWLPITKEHFDKHKEGFHPRCKECRKVEKKLELLNHGDRVKSRKRSPQARKNAVTRTKVWISENPERAKISRRAQVLRYRARKRDLADEFSKEHWTRLVQWWGDCCSYCGSKRDDLHALEADHLIPLSSANCPGTVVENMVLACRFCNASKSDMPVNDWLIQQYGQYKAAIILKRIQVYFEWASRQ